MYQWFVFTHLIGLVLFVFAHGVSAFVSWQIRTMRDPVVISGYLTMSQQATRAAYVGLLLLLSVAPRRRRKPDCGPSPGCGARDRPRRRVGRDVRPRRELLLPAP